MWDSYVIYQSLFRTTIYIKIYSLIRMR
jgi:hypothetical protein